MLLLFPLLWLPSSPPPSEQLIVQDQNYGWATDSCSQLKENKTKNPIFCLTAFSLTGHLCSTSSSLQKDVVRLTLSWRTQIAVDSKPPQTVLPTPLHTAFPMLPERAPCPLGLHYSASFSVLWICCGCEPLESFSWRHMSAYQGQKAPQPRGLPRGQAVLVNSSSGLFGQPLGFYLFIFQTLQEPFHIFQGIWRRIKCLRLKEANISMCNALERQHNKRGKKNDVENQRGKCLRVLESQGRCPSHDDHCTGSWSIEKTVKGRRV